MGSILYDFRKPILNAKYDYYYLADSTGRVESGQIFKRRYVNITNGLGGGQGVEPPFVITNPPIPSSRSSLMAISPDGNIISAWSQNFLIKEYGPEGKYQQAVYHPYENVPINTQNYMKRFRNKPAKYRNAVRNKLQDTWPALSYILLDDQNRLWVATIGNDPDNYNWMVVTPDGKFLAKFKWPGKRINREFAKRHIRVIKKGFLYAFKKDTTTGRDELVKYRIVMEPRAGNS